MKIQIVTDLLRKSISVREFAPGFHLQELVLAEKLGVSRTPIRSALSTLHQEGLLNYLPKRGYFVRTDDPDEVRQAWTFRGGLEGIAAQIVASKGPNEILHAKLQVALEKGDLALSEEALSPKDVALYRAMNNEFHGHIVAASENRFLIEAMQRFIHLPAYVQLIDMYYSTQLRTPRSLTLWLRRMQDDHHRIADALHRGEQKRVEALMVEHHHHASTYIIGQLKTLMHNFSADNADSFTAATVKTQTLPRL